MKKYIFIIGIVIASLSVSSCRTTAGGYGQNASMISNTKLETFNEYDLDVSENPIEHMIDISTPSGKAKLNKLSLKQAQELVLREAVMKSKCALLFNPQYTYVKKGKRILRIKVYGFPAVYKNQK